jgi:hypothetical protein
MEVGERWTAPLLGSTGAKYFATQLIQVACQSR